MNNSKQKRYWLLGAIFFFAIAALLSGIRPAGNRMTNQQMAQYASENNLKAIFNYFEKYKSQHNGQSPTRLKDLLPYSDGDLRLFYSSYSKGPEDRFQNPSRLDLFTSYALVNKANSDVIATEKPGLYPDGTVGIVLKDGRVMRLSCEEFANLKLLP